MHLSRIQINPARRGGRKLLGSPQAMHAAVLASFPDDSDTRGRVLWRVDRDEQRIWLYVLSGPIPDFSHIVEQAGWQTREDSWVARPYDGLLKRLAEGQTYGFRLTANPTRTHAGKRYAHVTVAQQERWLLDRAEGWGFAVVTTQTGPALTVHDRRTEQFRRNGAIVTIAKATFDGVLTVTDAEALRRTLVAGAGRAKGYGCGLLTLAPAG